MYRLVIDGDCENGLSANEISDRLIDLHVALETNLLAVRDLMAAYNGSNGLAVPVSTGDNCTPYTGTVRVEKEA